MTDPRRYWASQVLHELDWQPQCECTHKHECTKPAAHILLIHNLHKCREEGLTPDGNRPAYRCHECLHTMQEYIQVQLDRLGRRGIASCATCGSPIVTVSDVIREVLLLRNGKIT